MNPFACLRAERARFTRLPSRPESGARWMAILAATAGLAGTGLAATYTEVNSAGSFTWNSAPWTLGIPDGTLNDSGLLHGNGTMTIDAASTGTTPGSLMVGWQGNFTLNITGGTLTVHDDHGEGFAIGESGVGTVTQTGGTVSATAVRFARSGGSSGTYNLNGGILSAGLVTKGSGTTGTLELNGGTLQASVSSNSWFIAGLDARIGSGGATVDTQGFDVTISSPLVDDVVNANGGLRKIGSPTTSTGVLRLAAINTYTGNTNIDQGFLVTSISGALPSTTVVNFNNVGGAVSQLDLVGTNQKVQGLASNVPTATMSISSTGGLGSLEVATPTGQTYTYQGTLSGSATNFIKSGGGTQILTGAVTNNGSTVVAGGTLQIGTLATTTAGSVSGPIVIDSGASLVYLRDNNQVPGYGLSLGAIAGEGDLILQGEKGGYYSISAGGGNAQAGLFHSGLTTVNLDPSAASFTGTLFVESDAANHLSPSSVLNMLSGAVDLRSSQVVGGLSGTGGFIFNDLGGVTVMNDRVPSGQTLNFSGVLGKGPGFGSNTTLALTKSGPGTQNLAGSNTLTTETTVNAGTLGLDFTTANTSKLGGGLILGGGNLAILPNTGAATVQTVTATTLNAGGSTVTVTKNAGTNSAALNLNGLTRNLGGTLNVVYGGTGSGTAVATTDLLNGSNGILGGWATFGGADWAVNSENTTDSPIVALAAGSYVPNTWAAGNNTDVTASSTPATGSTTATLRFNEAAASTLTLAGVNTVSAGGILVTPAVANHPSNITAGTLEGASGADLIVHQFNTANSLTIGSVIADDTSATALTKVGPGALILTGANTYTGATNLFGGTVSIGSIADGGLASPLGASANTATNLVFNSGVLQYTGGTASTDRNFTLNDQGTIEVTSAGTALTVNGIASGAGSFVKAGAGTLILGSVNTYAGATYVNAGTLQNGNNNATTVLSGNRFIVASGARLAFSRNADSVQFTTQSISGAGDVSFIGQNAGYYTFRNNYAGILDYTGKTIINPDTTGTALQWFERALWVERDDTLSHGSIVDLEAGKLFLRNNSSAGETVAGLMGNGGTFITTDSAVAFLQKLTLNVPSGSVTFAGTIGVDASAVPIIGTNVGAIAVTKAGAGTQIFSGANSYVGPTAVNGGLLQVDGSLTGTTSVIVQGGATLGGGGTITTGNNGSVILATGANLSPGQTAGTLTLQLGTGQLDLSAVGAGNAHSLLFALGTASDEVLLGSGTLNLGTGQLGFGDFAFSDAGGLAPGTYTLIDASSAVTGTLDSANLAGSLGNGLTGTLILDSTANNLNLVVAVPEPTSMGSLLAGVGLLCSLRRPRRRLRSLV